LLVFPGVDVVGDHREIEQVTHAFAQRVDERGLAGADGTADPHSQYIGPGVHEAGIIPGRARSPARARERHASTDLYAASGTWKHRAIAVDLAHESHAFDHRFVFPVAVARSRPPRASRGPGPGIGAAARVHAGFRTPG